MSHLFERTRLLLRDEGMQRLALSRVAGLIMAEEIVRELVGKQERGRK